MSHILLHLNRAGHLQRFFYAFSFARTLFPDRPPFMTDGHFPMTVFYLKQCGAEAVETVSIGVGFLKHGTVLWGQQILWEISYML